MLKNEKDRKKESKIIIRIGIQNWIVDTHTHSKTQIGNDELKAFKWFSISNKATEFHFFLFSFLFERNKKENTLQISHNSVIIFHAKIDSDTHIRINMWLWTLFSVFYSTWFAKLFVLLNLQYILYFCPYFSFHCWRRSHYHSHFIRLNVSPWINCFQFRAIDNNGTHSS